MLSTGYFDQVITTTTTTTTTTKMRRIRKRSASTSTRAGAAAASVLLASGVALLVLDESSLFSSRARRTKHQPSSRRSLLGSKVTGNDYDPARTADPAITTRNLSTDERLLQMTAEDASSYGSIWSSGSAAAASGAGDRRGLRTLLEEELHAAMTEENAGSEIWLINQPKCGTGTLLASMIESFDCKDNYGQDTVQHLQLKSTSCRNDVALKFTHHPHDAKAFKDLIDSDRRRIAHLTMGQSLPDDSYTFDLSQRGKCFVITSIRDPIHTIPSLFFWINRDRYCDGMQSKEEVLAEYVDWLRNTKGTDPLGTAPQTSFQTTSELLQMFGIGREDFRPTLDKVADDGHVVLPGPSHRYDIWYGCTLLLLQVDWERGFDHMTTNINQLDGIDEVTLALANDMDHKCPASEELHRAVKEYELSEEMLRHLARDNPELWDGIEYYRHFNEMRLRGAQMKDGAKKEEGELTSGVTGKITAALVDTLPSSGSSEATQALAAEKSIAEEEVTGGVSNQNRDYPVEDTTSPPEIEAVDELPIIDA